MIYLPSISNLICLQESWFSDTGDLSLIQLSGYDCISQGKSCSNKGRLITYIDQQFNYELNMKLNTYKHWEVHIIQVNGRGLHRRSL